MKPLAGIRVLDVSRLLPGPMCSWYMVGMGARVTKVEQPGLGDPLRHAPPFDEAGMGAWFAAINAGMESVALDLKSTPHRAAFRALLSDADVLIEGFRPGVMKRLGLDPADLLEAFPSLVICSISGFGQDVMAKGKSYVAVEPLVSPSLSSSILFPNFVLEQFSFLVFLKSLFFSFLVLLPLWQGVQVGL